MSASWGSAGPCCLAQLMFLPYRADLVQGRKKLVISNFWWSRSTSTCLHVTWVSWLNAMRLGTVNSPTRAVTKKVVMRQVKIAVLSGLERESWARILVMISMMHGSCLDHLDEASVRAHAAFISTSILSELNSQGML